LILHVHMPYMTPCLSELLDQEFFNLVNILSDGGQR